MNDNLEIWISTQHEPEEHLTWEWNEYLDLESLDKGQLLCGQMPLPMQMAQHPQSATPCTSGRMHRCSVVAMAAWRWRPWVQLGAPQKSSSQAVLDIDCQIHCCIIQSVISQLSSVEKDSWFEPWRRWHLNYTACQNFHITGKRIWDLDCLHLWSTSTATSTAESPD